MTLATPTLDPAKAMETIAKLRALAELATDDKEARWIISQIAQVTRQYKLAYGIGMPKGPVEHALEVDPSYRVRPHLQYLSDRIANAVRDVERGQNRMLAVSMPPRAGKSTLLSFHSPTYFLRRHPDWKIMMASYDGGLAKNWATNVRTVVEHHPDLGIALKRDGGKGSKWETVEGGSMFTTSVRGTMTGRGARVMIIDDPVKDFVEAHSLAYRQNLWNWWLSVAQTRLEPPYLVIVVMTRWHEDDFVGRLLSTEHEGNPKDWEKISLPALADTDDDVLGREQGEPLLTPLFEETIDDAVARWESVRVNVGTYTFSSMYQQRPAPAKGAIFDSGWWRFWTMDPEKATDDGRVVYLDPSAQIGGQWCDSWDANFGSSETSRGGWVVGQRWVRVGANRYLVAQMREKWSFTQTLWAMKKWAGMPPDDWPEDEPYDPWTHTRSPWGNLVHERLVEKKANGAALINTLSEQISGIKPITPTTSKENRARAITPECESGNVFLPHPSDPGNEWVTDLLSELRNFPHDAHDDQVDALTQALSHLRGPGRGQVTNPARPRAGQTWQRPRNVAQAAMTDLARHRNGNGYHR
jgi:predicted phage terminase large subunit-like protein